MAVWPNGTKTKPTTSYHGDFGPRPSPGGIGSTNHKGWDSIGYDTICAVEAGTVRAVGTPSGWAGGGVQVWIQHDGWFSKSLHMRVGSPLVQVGDQVSEGQALGRQGDTGVAVGVHLHFEATLGDVHYSNTGQIDPVPFLSNRISSGSGAGGGGTPFPNPKPGEEEDDMYNSGIMWVDGVQRFAIVNTTSGLFTEWNGTNGDYNDAMRKTFRVESFAPVSLSHANRIRTDCTAVRPK